MKQKHSTHNALLAILLLVMILSILAGCVRGGRGSQSYRGVANETIEIEIWTNRENYDLGEPVKVRVKLRNVSDQAVTLRSKSGTEPVLDIVIQRGPSHNPEDRRVWSENHPNEVLHTLILKPGEVFTVEWSQVLSIRGQYGILVEWIDNANYLRTQAMSISYGTPRGMP